MPTEDQQKQDIELIEDAIALATHDFRLLPGIVFQSQVAQLNVAYQTVSITSSLISIIEHKPHHWILQNIFSLFAECLSWFCSNWNRGMDYIL